MTKRSPTTGYSGSRNAPSSPFTAWASDSQGPESRQRSTASSEVKPELKRGKSLEKKPSTDTWHHDSSLIHLLGNFLKVRIIEKRNLSKSFLRSMIWMHDLQLFHSVN